MPLEPELFRALGALSEAPAPAHARLAEALGLPGVAGAEDHTQLFVFQLVPYASVYLGPEGMMGGEARDRVAGFWRALHLTPPNEPDHLAILLGLYASLGEREAAESEPDRRLMWVQARRTLLWEHLLTWLPAYTNAVIRVASGFYAAWAALLIQALGAEARELTAPAFPMHLRDMPAVPDPREESFIRALLAPARSGLIITRDDLAHGARKTGLGLRMGERAFVLRSLIEQDPVATFGWLVEEAARWESQHATTTAVAGDASQHWLVRAEATRLALDAGQRVAMAHVIA